MEKCKRLVLLDGVMPGIPGLDEGPVLTLTMKTNTSFKLYMIVALDAKERERSKK